MRRRSTQSTKHYDELFRELFERYAGDIYRLLLSAVVYNDVLAQELLLSLFKDIYKHIHLYTKEDSAARQKLFARTIEEIKHSDFAHKNSRTQAPASIAQTLESQLAPIELRLWQTVQQLPREERQIVDLLYGEKFGLSELAGILQQPFTEVQRLYANAFHHIRQVASDAEQYLPSLYDKHHQWVRLSRSQRISLLRQLQSKRKPHGTFAEYPLWRYWLRPIPLIVGASVLTIAGVVAASPAYLPRMLELARQSLEQQSTTTLDVIEPLYISTTRPREITPETTLPTISEDKLSLTKTTEILYGTSYVSERDIPADDSALTPTITIDLPRREYIPVSQAFVYAVPEALDEEQLQYAALRHFSSMPLNQFEYVNGTYYLGEDPEMYQPLFIAFNATGSIDYQMRQASICALPQLTESITDGDAEQVGFDFLTSHNFVEVARDDLDVQIISSEGRTVPKDAFCKDGDQTAVQDREIVYFPPHTVFRSGEDVSDTMAMRFSGIAIQLHGRHVTNLRIDKLFLLQQSAVRTHEVELKSLKRAVAELKQFSYPAAAEHASVQQTQQVFAQWNQSYGDERLTSMTLTSSRLEYVFDELHYTIEPYYVFSGKSKNLSGRTLEVRMYVVASTEQRDLRSPYRE